MLWCSLPELDLCFGLLLVIVYGLTSLRHKHVSLSDVHFFCQAWPLLLVFSYCSQSNLLDWDAGFAAEGANQYFVVAQDYSFDILLCLLTFVILMSFKSFESLLLIMMAYIGQSFLLHSCDLVTFYVCLEAQNFCFLVLCGLQPDKESSGFSVESSLKYLLLSAFSSGMILFWFSALYLRTGMSGLFMGKLSLNQGNQVPGEGSAFSGPADLVYGLDGFESFQILLALLFKLGTAPIHLWVVDIYQSLKKPLLMYISTAPKLSLFCFWSSAWHQVWTDFSLGVFVCFSMILGSLGAYGQPALRALFAYSTINEIGLMLLAIEAAGFHSLFQHLTIYVITQLLLWNLSDKRLFSLGAVSLAGLPPLAGFFGKVFIFWHAINSHLFFLLAASLFCTGLSLVYYLRLLRVFWNQPNGQTLYIFNTITTNTLLSAKSSGKLLGKPKNVSEYTVGLANPKNVLDNKVGLTSALAVSLCFLPIFFVKPFVL